MKENNVSIALNEMSLDKYKTYKNNIDVNLILNEESSRDIAIIGIGLKISMANDIEEFWCNIKNRIDCVTSLPADRERNADSYLRFRDIDLDSLKYLKGSYLRDIDKFDYDFFRMSPMEASLMNPLQRIFLEIVWNTIEDAGYGGKKIKGSETGIYLGLISDLEGYKYKEMIHEINPEYLPVSAAGNLTSMIPSRISYLLDLKGPSMVMDSACSSSLVAVHVACQAIRNGDCEMAVAGGAKINLLPIDKEYYKIGTDSPDGITRAFDDNANGSGMGEGVAAVLLKPLRAAKRDGDNIYAIIKGSAINQDGKSMGITAPNPSSQANVILKAWKNANVDPETIDYIETHGTATKLGDPIEIEGLKTAFARHTKKRQFCAISSVKSNLGHLYESAGITNLIKGVLALKCREIPPTIHFDKPNSKINFHDSAIYVNTRSKKWITNGHPRRCGISAFGINGTNCHIILEEYDKHIHNDKLGDYSDSCCQVLTLSAKSENSLKSLINKYSEFTCKKLMNSELESICYTANTGRGHYNYRLAIITNGIADLKQKIEIIKESELCDINGDWYFYGKNKDADENGALEDGRVFGELADQAIKEYLGAGRKSVVKLQNICDLYIKGADMQWEALYEGKMLEKRSLPVYQFERKTCWLDIPDYYNRTKDNETDGLYYAMNWIRENSVDDGGILDNKGTIIFMDDKGIGSSLSVSLRSLGINVLEVEFGEEFRNIDGTRFVIRGNEEDYEMLSMEIHKAGISRIIHLSSIKQESEIGDLGELEKSQKRGVYSLFRLVGSILTGGLNRDIEIVLVSDYVNEVTGEEIRINPENAPLFGLAKVIKLEYPQISCKCLDIDDGTSMDDIKRELRLNSGRYMSALRNGCRYVEEFEKVDIEKHEECLSDIKEDGIYIITGGTGVIGLEVAKYLADRGKVKLALINRSPMPEREKWTGILDNGEGSKLYKKIRAIVDIESSGTEVNCYSADVSNIDEMRSIVDELRGKYGKINGIIHCAGVTGNGFIINREEKAFDEVLYPKIYGTWVIDHLTREDKPDFFIMFSSGVSIIGEVGLGDYTAANSYMDSYCAYRSREGQRTLTINWVVWKEARMKDGFSVNVDGIFKSISSTQAIKAFDRVLNRSINRVLIGEMDFDSEYIRELDKFEFKISDRLKDKIRKNSGMKSLKTKADSQKNIDNVEMSGKENNSYTDIEKRIGQIWGAVLGFKSISILDNFYELGGDSISGLKIANMINIQMNININTSDLLKYPTIEKLADFLEEKLYRHIEDTNESNIYTAILPLDESSYYDTCRYPEGFFPASSAQKRLYILDKIGDTGVSYNIFNAVTIEGRLDVKKIEMTFNKLVDRHETLRTSFTIFNEEIVQVVHNTVDFKISFMEGDENEVQDIIGSFIRPFNLEEASLMRVGLIRVASDRHILLTDLHHIITDGLSMDILIREIAALYEGRQLPKPKIQYKDFSVWQNNIFKTEIIKEHEKYWVSKLSTDVAGELPILDISVDFPRPAIKSYEGRVKAYKAGKELTARINELGVKTGTTMYMILLAAYDILLSRYSGQEDIIVGSPIVGRPHADLDSVFGMFVNMLVMRNKLDGNKSFSEFLEEVKQTCLDAYRHQDYQFDELVDKLGLERDLSRNPVFDAVFMLQNVGDRIININELRFTPYKYDTGISKYDISLEAIEKDGDIILNLEYCTKIFRDETIDNMYNHFINILEAVSCNMELKLSQIGMLSRTEKDRLLYSFNDTGIEYNDTRTIHSLFEDQAGRTPDLIALVFKDKSLTYRELNERADILAAALRKRLLQDEDNERKDCVVGIMVKRSIEMIVAIMGVLKAGAAYLPIDPEYPDERVNYMLLDSGTGILISQKSVYMDRNLASMEVVDIEDTNMHINGSVNLKHTVNSNSLAYLIYTSGSTGKPKGVMIEHRPVVNFIKGITEKIQFTPERTILALTTISFDIFVLETLLPLSMGLKIVIADENQQIDPELLGEVIVKNKVDMIQMTPSRMQLLTSNKKGAASLEKVKDIMVGGEPFPVNLLDELKKLTGANIYNMYGPTETTVWSTLKDLTGASEINIGKPISNTRIYILDRYNNLLPQGIKGELCIGGDGLARGYLNRADLTDEKFIPDPFVNGQRIYRTGDMARFLPTGEIECFGRADQQEKIRGYRIEPGEIETVILSHKAVNKAVVTTRQDAKGMKYLCAYIVTCDGLPVKDLREYISKELPEYMIPSYFICIKELPMTPNGKIDRKSLPDPGYESDTRIEYAAPENEVEEKLVQIWGKLLGRDNIGVNDKFFEIGGNSMLLVKMHGQIEMEYPGKVKVADLFNYTTVSTISNLILKGDAGYSRKISLSSLQIPDNYFVTDGNISDEFTFDFEFEENTINKLNLISKDENIELHIILLSAYIYLLSKISDCRQLALQAAVSEYNTIVEVAVDMESMEDFSQLFNLTEKMLMDHKGLQSYEISELNMMSVNKPHRSIIPLFALEGMIFNRYSSLLRIYDIVMTASIGDRSLGITCGYNGKRINREKVIQLFKGYVKTINLIAGNYGANNG